MDSVTSHMYRTIHKTTYTPVRRKGRVDCCELTGYADSFLSLGGSQGSKEEGNGCSQIIAAREPDRSDLVWVLGHIYRQEHESIVVRHNGRAVFCRFFPTTEYRSVCSSINSVSTFNAMDECEYCTSIIRFTDTMDTRHARATRNDSCRILMAEPALQVRVKYFY